MICQFLLSLDASNLINLLMLPWFFWFTEKLRRSLMVTTIQFSEFQKCHCSSQQVDYLIFLARHCWFWQSWDDCRTLHSNLSKYWAMHCLLSRQRYDMHQLFLSFIFGLITGLLLGGWFSKVEMAGVLQEAGDADSRARTRSQAQVELHLSLCLHLTFVCYCPRYS